MSERSAHNSPVAMEPQELAWLAGLFEGEGCILDAGNNSVALTIGMNDVDIIQRVLSLTGVGGIYENKTNRSNTLYVWKAGRKTDVAPLLKAMLPFFGERRSERARAALLRLEGCFDFDEGFCRNGHEWAGDLYIWRDHQGRQSRRCGQCRREADQKRQPRRRVT